VLSQQFYRKYGKRLFDMFWSIIGVIILSPVYMIIAIAVYFKLGSPILFRQTRSGLQGKPFTLLKFRTMKDTLDQSGKQLPDSVRLTPFGRFLRHTSLDEIPSLLNVLRGEMSIVGPRPLLMQYLTRYNNRQKRRHEIKPGITGWAQVNGRNAISWKEKLSLDVWYVDHFFFWLDLKIISITILKILNREGINQPGQATAEEFKGSGV